MSEYQLPCECGRMVVVTTTQAGQPANCECGITLDVPNLREMRKLKTADPVQAGEKVDVRERRNWSRMQGTIFAIGMFAAFVGLVMTLIMYYFRSTIEVSIPEQFRPDWGDQQIDRMKADRTFDLWQNLRDDKLKYQGRAPWVAYQDARSQATAMLYSFAAVLMLGIIASISAFFLPGDTYARRPRAT